MNEERENGRFDPADFIPADAQPKAAVSCELEEPPRGSALTGILGALFGALVGVVPWFLASTFADFFVGWLGFLVGVAACWGYRLFKGRRSTRFAMATVIVCSLLALFAAEIASWMYVLCSDPEWQADAAWYGIPVAQLAWESILMPENWGIMAPSMLMGMVIGVLGVNFAFTKPYFKFCLSLSGYPLAFLSMLAVSVTTSAMTTQIKWQEEQHYRAELEEMRANLLRAVSHDLRTPLTSIYGACSTVIENYDSLDKEKTIKLLGEACSDAQWLTRMVENLLSITRISGEQTAISKEYEAAEEILAASVHKFEKRFKSNIRIAVEVPQEVVLVPMDATLIQQVLLNLMENAVLHGESTTELRLSVEHIGDEACFTVSDNGLGIPRERLATLFDGSLSGEKGGGFDMKKNMGIGLSVCQTIVKAHGGRITAENRPEGGAQFRFYLPLKEEKEDEDQG